MLRTLALAAMLCTSLHPIAGAQTALRIRADNDAFNFWQPPWERPDEEYSSGVRISADFHSAPFWSRRLPWGAVTCETPGEACATQTWTLGQDIFTAARRATDPVATATARPNAGVLWLQSTERSSTAERMVERSITLGATGEPSLASTMQRIVHGYSAAWQRPIDWSHQLPFEPLVNVSYDQYRRADYRGMHVLPHAGISVGNLLTEGRAGVEARAGRNLSAPWSPAPTRGVELSMIADASLRVVARNETLSGNLLRSSERRTLRPLVPELQLGLSARFSRATVSYVVHQRGAEYLGRAAPHWWSLLQTQWQFGR